ncbi:MAG: replication initiation protein, partial [Bacteroidales bacterium]
NFSKGFRKYELKTAMSFTSVYAMRFYELFSGVKRPLVYSINELKDRFKVQNKYDRINDFVRYVIEPAKKELDEKSPYTFTYKLEKTGRKFTHIRFYPVYQAAKRDPSLERKELAKQVNVSWILGKEEREYLAHNFGFSPAEIKRNMDLFSNAAKTIKLLSFFDKIRPKANRANNTKGYVINAIKNEINTTFAI